MFRFFKLIFFVIVAIIAGKMMARDAREVINQESVVESTYAQMARLLVDPEFKEQNPAEYRRLAALALMLRARTLAMIADSSELES